MTPPDHKADTARDKDRLIAGSDLSAIDRQRGNSSYKWVGVMLLLGPAVAYGLAGPVVGLMVYSSGWLMAAGVLGVVAALAYLWVFRASLADRVGLVRGHKPLILALFVVLAVFNFLTVMGLAPWFVGTEAREAALLISDRPKAGETAGRACQHHLTLRRAGGAVEGTCADRIVAQPLLPGPVEMTLRTGPAGSAIVEIRPLR